MFTLRKVNLRDVMLACFWVLAVICILNLNAIMRMGFNVYRSLSAIMLLSCFGTILLSRKKLKIVLGKPGLMCLVFFASFMVIGYFSSIVHGTDAVYWVEKYFSSILVILAAAIAGWHFAQREHMHRFYQWFCILLLISATSILFSDILRDNFQIGYKYDYRNSGFFANPNQAGLMACMALSSGFALLRLNRHRFLVTLGILICGYCAFLTFSKTAYLVVLVLTFLQFFLARSTTLSKLYGLFIASSIFLATFWVLTIGITTLDWKKGQLVRLNEVKTALVGRSVEDIDFTGREVTWRVGLEKFLESPIIGNGLGSLTLMEEISLGVHNTYLTIVGEAGILPGILFAFFLLHLGLGAWRCRSPETRFFVLGYLVTFALGCMVSHNILTRRYQDLMLGLCIGLVSGREYFWFFRDKLNAKLAAAAQQETESNSEEKQGTPSKQPVVPGSGPMTPLVPGFSGPVNRSSGL